MPDTRTHTNVWDALTDNAEEAANLTVRSDLMIAISGAVERWELTQLEAARRLGITQPRLNKLLNGKIDQFSLDMLLNLAVRAGLDVRVEITRAQAQRPVSNLRKTRVA
jgi:predicted XRE-type DNA-binding protein